MSTGVYSFCHLLNSKLFYFVLFVVTILYSLTVCADGAELRMEPNYPESRGGGNGGGRRPRQNRGRGARNGFGADWERSFPDSEGGETASASHGFGAASGPKPRRNRGQRGANRNYGEGYPQQVADNKFYAGRQAEGFYERGLESSVLLNHQQPNVEESRHLQRSRGGGHQKQQNRPRGSSSSQAQPGPSSFRNHNDRNQEPNQHAEQYHTSNSGNREQYQSSFPYPPTMLQENQSYYDSGNAIVSHEFHRSSSETVEAMKPKQQSRGQRQGSRNAPNDFRRSRNVPSSENFPSVARASPTFPVESFTLEHQPYDIVAREYSGYFNSGSGRSSSSIVHHNVSNGNVPQEGRNRRDERPKGSAVRPPENRQRRDEWPRGGGSQTMDRFVPVEQSSHDRFGRQRREDIGPPAVNWRSQRFQPTAKKMEPVADTATQRERLTSQLTSGTYECMVCCESVKPVQVFNPLDFFSYMPSIFFYIQSIFCLLYFSSRFGIAANVFMSSI